MKPSNRWAPSRGARALRSLAGALLVLSVVPISCKRPVQPPAEVSPAAAPDAVVAPVPTPDPPPGPAAGGDGGTCLATITTDRSRSCLEEARRLGVPLEDWQNTFAAVRIDEAQDRPMEAFAEFRIGDAPLLWLASNPKAVVVDARHFSDLAAVDLPRLDPGERVVVGRFLSAGDGGLAPRRLVEFLIAAEILRTYWHIGAEICLREESAAGGAYRATFDAVHTYYTNEENRDEYSFEVTLGADGEIAVGGP